MNSISNFDALDHAIDQMMSAPNAVPDASGEMAELLAIARDLRTMPRPAFKTQLALELNWKGEGRLIANQAPAEQGTNSRHEILPGLSGNGFGIYPVSRASFAASLALHAATAACIALGLFVAKSAPHIMQPNYRDVESLTLAPGFHSHGGGGGGNREKLMASQGQPPRTANEQITPPVVQVPQQRSKLEVEPTVTAELKLPTPGQVGDQLSNIMPPSNGTGLKNGVGSGEGGGVGPGSDTGYGPGSDGNFGTGYYRPGNGVTAPRILYAPEPEFSEEARRVKHQGTVTLKAIIGTDGIPRNIHVEQSLGLGLDEKAIETLRAWRFEPGKKDGHPVAVQMYIEVHFNIF
jgi:TonB family protein